MTPPRSQPVEAAGIACRAVPLLMPDVPSATAMARSALALAAELRAGRAG